MDYSFIRKLTTNIDFLEIKKLYAFLSQNGIEVFIKVDETYVNLTENDLREERLSEGNICYVSAADLEVARKVVKEVGLEQYLCSETESSKGVRKSELEKAEEEFYRKHKQNQMFGLVVIVAVMIFMFIQFFFR